CGTELRRRNFVVFESLGGCQRDLPRLAWRRGKSAEIALKHGRAGNVGDILRRFGALNGALVSSKEKKLVLYYGPADDSAELVSLQRVALWRKEIARVENSIPHEFKRVAVELVRAGLSDDIHISRCVNAVLRRQRTGFDFEFL